LTSLFKRSSGLVLCNFVWCWLGATGASSCGKARSREGVRVTQEKS
jgi:hypothetical protein